MLLLNVFQIRAKHLENDFEIASEQKRIFGDEEVSALVAKTGYVYATAACGKLSVFDHDALMARRGETVAYEIGKRAFQIEYWGAFFHHFGYRAAACGLFFAAERQVLRVGIRRMEIERDRADVFHITGC